jgi:hypothetical protein
VPLRWDGDPASLPDGIDGVLPLAVEQHASGVAPNTLCALQAVVVAAYQGQGLASVPVREWERWTGLVFPGSGSFVVPVALVPRRGRRRA